MGPHCGLSATGDIHPEGKVRTEGLRWFVDVIGTDWRMFEADWSDHSSDVLV